MEEVREIVPLLHHCLFPPTSSWDSPRLKPVREYGDLEILTSSPNPLHRVLKANYGSGAGGGGRQMEDTQLTGLEVGRSALVWPMKHGKVWWVLLGKNFLSY